VDHLAAAAGGDGEREQHADEAPAACRSIHVANATIAAMSPSGAAIAALVFASAGGALAADAGTRVRLDVRAPPECSSRADLAARVAARSPHIQIADDAAISADVTLASDHTGSVVADVTLAGPGASPSPRRVVARTCAEAADAVALIIAVTLDPSQRRKVSAGPPPARTAGEAAAATAAPVENASPRPPVPAPEAPVSPPPTAAIHAAPPSAAPAVAPARQFGVTVAGQTIFGPAPSVSPGVALYAMAALDRTGPWAPALVLGATHVWRDGLAEAGGAASFALDAASVDACPVRLAWSRLTARPCASALVGRMSARGSDTQQGSASARPFAVAGAALTAGFESRVVVSVRLAVGATLIRDSYQFATAVFYRAAAITTSASVGVGVRWP
jgi:hypothetical protein